MSDADSAHTGMVPVLFGEIKRFLERHEPIHETTLVSEIVSITGADEDDVESALEQLILHGEVYISAAEVKLV